MTKSSICTVVITLGLALASQIAISGPLDPDCTAEKAAKSSAAKATVGVGGRCSPAEAAKDTAKGAVGKDDKTPLKKDDNRGKDKDKNKDKNKNKNKDQGKN